jgi:hypothetical protein
MNINGLQFYWKFVYPDKSSRCRSIQDIFGEGVNNKFVIAAHTTVYKNENNKPVSKFAVLGSPLLYLGWMDQKSKEYRNDFEYIINPMRKFFIDIDGGLLNDDDYIKYNTTKEHYIANYNNAEKLMGIIVEIIDRFQRIIGPLNLEKDVLLCGSSGQTSDGTYKFSYHLIFTKYMFHYEDCISLRTMLVDGFEDIVKFKIIDPSVYKANQQLRLLYNEKLGSNRPKNVININYHGRITIHKTFVQPLDHNHERQLLLLESLIGFRHDSQVEFKALLTPLTISNVKGTKL